MRLTAWWHVGLAVLMAVTVIGPRAALAHCDTLDGPVVADARLALQKSDVTPVLKWVKADDEPEVRAAFQKTLAVRKLSPEGKELADMYFFETLVRLHRAGEGAPYTGLKPAGTVDPVIAAADKALDTGSVSQLAQHIGEAVSAGIRQRFTHAVEARKQADQSVGAGRAYVAAYVEFVHYVERLHLAATGPMAHGEAAAPEHEH